MKNENGTKGEVINLIRNANTKIQVAVSWLTDEQILQALTEATNRVKVELLLSQDPLNAAFRYYEIRKLQNSGAKVVKTGAMFPGQKGFMHAKFIIIDEFELYGGSFNYTDAASYNYEVFGKYDSNTLNRYKLHYDQWMSDSIDYKVGFEDPESINSLVIEQFKANEVFRDNMVSACGQRFEEPETPPLSERESILKQELRKEGLRRDSMNLVNNKVGISEEGKLVRSDEAVKSKNHRFYGGSFLSNFRGEKLKNSFAQAVLQKRKLERKFPFFRNVVQNDVLISSALISIDNCPDYKIRIEYKAGMAPKVFIRNQDIVPNSDIHMYSDGSLCLFYPGDEKWKLKNSIADYIVPWLYEWIIFHELYKLTGVWEGKYKDHGNNIYHSTL